ncbi:MAG: hypothetical protein J1E56_06490 [Ruminococcus sp.]|nr:hypothetical protein [Ruminococcus sp.]
MKETKPKYFCCYLDNETILNHLTDEQAGQLWKLLYAYANRNSKSDIDNPLVAMGFDVFSQQIDRDFEKYQEKCEKNRANASNRKRPLTNASNGSQDKDKDKEKNKREEKEEYINNVSTSVDSRATFDYQSVVNSFNSICVSLPKIQKLTDSRKKKIKSACSQLENMSFEEFFRKVENSDFLTGRNGIWTGCSFDWILKTSNVVKILEGNYNNQGNTANTIYYEEF